MFGGGAAPPGGGGTKVPPYQATTRQDGTSSIQMQTITAMQQYETKSLDELRYEDYMQGNKGTGTAGGAAPGGFGAFGSPGKQISDKKELVLECECSHQSCLTAPAPAGGIFGSPAPAFGQRKTCTYRNFLYCLLVAHFVSLDPRILNHKSIYELNDQ